MFIFCSSDASRAPEGEVVAQKVFKTGNSLAVTVPADFANSVGVRPGDKVLARQERTKARIVYQFSGAQQLPLDEVFFSKRKRKKPRKAQAQRGKQKA